MIALLTDFGLKDFFVAQMKGVIFSINEKIKLIDLTHELEPCNIKQAQFFIQFSYKYFPENTIFCCVVDPGVGTCRKPIAVKFNNMWFVGPDNGLFSFAKNGEIFEIVNNSESISKTFHARDIFAPVAAKISKNDCKNLMKVNKLEVVKPLEFIDKIGTYNGEILHIDRFGNMITNIHNHNYKRAKIHLNNVILSKFCETFEQSHEELFIIKGSCGLLEIVCNKKSAAELTGLKINTRIKVEIYETT